jgi:hypothetical protein
MGGELMARDPKIYAIGDAALQSIMEQSSSSGGRGGGGSGLDARVAKVEATIEHIQRDTSDIKEDIRDLRRNATNDFRILFAAIIGVALGLAGLMAKGFHWF